MLFSSPIFLFYFLPIVIIGYYLFRGNWRNVFLFISSLVFFAWGGVSYSILLIGSIVMNYFMGLLVGKNPGTKRSKNMLIIGVSLNLLLLVIFKYANFIIENLNFWLDFLKIPPIENDSIILPVGISFYTFQSLSYLVDIYRKETPMQKNILRLGLYISLFPQLIAGPIVRYIDIAAQLEKREVSIEKFSYGVQRFITGLAKKVLLANSFGYVADNIFTIIPSDLSSMSAWLGVIAYTFQIYFDFSGYSDMAIGLGSIFGFRILENFNFPYISRSIKEFWRRWHISLSTWFRDYLYIPLGGNRLGTRRTYINLIIVFFLTGLWHGASWNFVAWGLLHGFFLVLERLGGDRLLQKLWKPFQHIYTLAVVVFAWVLFRADDFQYAWGYYKAMLGLNDSHSGMYEIAKFMNPEFLVVLIIGTLASVMVFKKLRIYIDGFLSDQHGGRLIAMQSTFTILMILFYFGLFVLCSMYLLSNTYNPFIYYRF
jgi:alginate O-acetyltransferase complex protein AlgI